MRVPFVSRGDAPVYGNAHAAGFDVRSAERMTLPPRVLRTVSTGLAVAIPPGMVGVFRGRSGWAFKQGVWVYGGTIDEDYRGEIMVQLINFSETSRVVEVGDRVGQILLMPYVRAELVAETELPPSPEGGRGVAGFGSTGVR